MASLQISPWLPEHTWLQVTLWCGSRFRAEGSLWAMPSLLRELLVLRLSHFTCAARQSPTIDAIGLLRFEAFFVCLLLHS